MNTSPKPQVLGPSRRGRPPNRVTKPGSGSVPTASSIGNHIQRTSRPNVSALELQDGTFAPAPSTEALMHYGDATDGILVASIGRNPSVAAAEIEDDGDAEEDVSMSDPTALHRLVTASSAHNDSNISPELSKTSGMGEHGHLGLDEGGLAYTASAAVAAAAGGTGGTTHQSQDHSSISAHAQDRPSSQNNAIQQPSASAAGKTTQEVAFSTYSNFKVETAFAKRMALEPALRVPEQRKPEQELNLARRSNVEALFAQISGRAMSSAPMGGGGGGEVSAAAKANQQCNHCRKTQGPWTLCVVYAGQLLGSCANCWFNASGARCSFHEKAKPQGVLGYAPTNPYVAVSDLHGLTTAPHLNTTAAGESSFADPSHTTPRAATTRLPKAATSAIASWQLPSTLQSADQHMAEALHQALIQARGADKYQRALMEVEITAKTLALQMVKAEEIAADSLEQQANGSGESRQEGGDDGSPQQGAEDEHGESLEPVMSHHGDYPSPVQNAVIPGASGV